MSAAMSTSSFQDKSTKRRKAKCFAPLNSEVTHGRDLPELKGIVFDVDGTLCLPQNYMFKEMRAALGIPKSVDILDHIRGLSNVPDGNEPTTSSSERDSNSATQSNPDDSDQPVSKLLSSSTEDTPSTPDSTPQSRAVAAIQGIERRAMTSQRPQPGLQALMAYLQRRGVRKALCTRNFPAPVTHLLENFLAGPEYGSFEPIITRDSEGIAPKPSPQGIWRIAEHWDLQRDGSLTSDGDQRDDVDPLELARHHLGAGLIMVGDSIDDMAAGYRAGAATVLLANDENEHLSRHQYTGNSVRRLDELIDVLESGFMEDT